MLSRRRFLAEAAGVAGGLFVGACSSDRGESGQGEPGQGEPGGQAPPPAPAASTLHTSDPELSAAPFNLGVASGDPLADRVVIWTRLAPDPLAGGGMPTAPQDVEWQMASDPGMSDVVRSGSVVARAEHGHSVHVDVEGLDPSRWYWYRFRSAGELSGVGRTRTAPAADASPKGLRFAVASCQDWQAGHYPAYGHLAEEDVDLVLHLGDYIYEGADVPGGPRSHGTPEPVSLVDYRNRHALYKSDAHLQRAHSAFPWIVTPDDHEVDNDYAGDVSSDGRSVAEFRSRRANAYQAYWEHMPLRSPPPSGPDLRLYRQFRFGDLAQFNVLDTRQYRSDQPCGVSRGDQCAAALDPAATMLGAEQERWLFENLTASRQRWNVMAQQVVMAEFALTVGTDASYGLDQWDGYVADRRRVLGFLEQHRTANPVVLSGDFHSNWVSDLRTDFADPSTTTVASEFTVTSISSSFGAAFDQIVRGSLPANSHVRFFDGRYRGYGRCTLGLDEWRTDYRVVDSVAGPQSPVRTLASFVVENGVAGARPA